MFHFLPGILKEVLFLQARPEDYSEDFLKPRKALSFHKHYNNDPLAVYNMLIEEEAAIVKEKTMHEELWYNGF